MDDGFVNPSIIVDGKLPVSGILRGGMPLDVNQFLVKQVTRIKRTKQIGHMSPLDSNIKKIKEAYQKISSVALSETDLNAMGETARKIPGIEHYNPEIMAVALWLLNIRSRERIEYAGKNFPISKHRNAIITMVKKSIPETKQSFDADLAIFDVLSYLDGLENYM